MLISKPIESGEIISLKIANGDELIAKVTSITDATVTVARPMMMVMGQDQMGRPGVSMVPFWIIGGDKDTPYPINRSHVVCMVKANPDAVKNYTSATTGLAMPGQGSGLIK